MNFDYSFFKVSDGQSLAYKVWKDVTNPKGVVILIHGMAEHIERYDDFATFLNSNGFIVYGTDQRGHGKTSGKKGIFTNSKSWKRVVEDQKEFYDFVTKDCPNLDISYFIHSMGSFIGRTLLGTYNLPVKKLIISGTGYQNGLTSHLGTFLAGAICKIRGVANDAVFLDGMVNNPFAASVKNPTTSFDWLSRDPDQVAKYVNDPNCGFICTNKFYYDFFNIITVACKKSTMKKMNKDTQILIYSGDEDPVGGKNISGVKKVYNLYKQLGLNVTMGTNPGGRHESVNETNKDDVYSIFKDFLLAEV
ncbi:MAG: alpha/beta fold hydrolase [Spirochaetales bacterium]|nr:alpha/beta fold hydrolase [Spirochaetales bacterium]